MSSRTDRRFAKYATRGAYHWEEISASLRKHNAFTQARYVRVLAALRADPGQRVLDVGCGDGALSALIARAGAHVTGIDNVPGAARHAALRTGWLPASFAAGSACALPVQSESFDAVVAAEVIEHLDRPTELLAEMHRVLRPGGCAIITTPHRLTERPLDAEHVAEFYPGEIAGLVGTLFDRVTVELSHPVWLTDLYLYRMAGHYWVRWAVNLLSVWVGYNPFLTSGGFRYYAQIVVVGIKPGLSK